LKIYQLYFLFLITIFSCKTEEVKTEDGCKIDAELVSQILKLNKHKVIESDLNLEDLQKEFGCLGVDSFFQFKSWHDAFISGVNKMSDDSLCHAVELGKFEENISKKENEGDKIIRVERATFVYGINEILLIEAHQKKDDIQLRSFEIHFDDGCNTALLEFPNGKEFTSKCFQIEKTNRKKISLSEWNEFEKIIIETDFNNIAYFQGGGKLLCHGSHYVIDYSAGYSLEYGVRHLEKSCPGELTAIYLISEKLIELSEIEK
jgi:hypothetical protein